MDERKVTRLSGCSPLYPVKETALSEDPSQSFRDTYQKQDKDILTSNKGLADDHMIATYWG